MTEAIAGTTTKDGLQKFDPCTVEYRVGTMLQTLHQSMKEAVSRGVTAGAIKLDGDETSDMTREATLILLTTLEITLLKDSECPQLDSEDYAGSAHHKLWQAIAWLRGHTERYFVSRLKEPHYEELRAYPDNCGVWGRVVPAKDVQSNQLVWVDSEFLEQHDGTNLEETKDD